MQGKQVCCGVTTVWCGYSISVATAAIDATPVIVDDVVATVAVIVITAGGDCTTVVLPSPARFHQYPLTVLYCAALLVRFVISRGSVFVLF